MNKFMAFYKNVEIYPTHVYFHDLHDNSFNFLQHIFRVCIDDRLSGLTFIVSDTLKGRLTSCWLESLRIHSRRIFYQTLKFFDFQEFRSIIRRIIRPIPLIKVPKNCKYCYVSVTHYLTGGPWATNLDTPLFHYRGSLTSVLNYVSIVLPDHEIYLVGTDFGDPDYFFEAALSQLDLEWKDWTYDLVKESGLHFSAQSFEGTTIFEAFPFIKESLRGTANRLYCINSRSLLVQTGCVQLQPLPLSTDCEAVVP